MKNDFSIMRRILNVPSSRSDGKVSLNSPYKIIRRNNVIVRKRVSVNSPSWFALFPPRCPLNNVIARFGRGCCGGHVSAPRSPCGVAPDLKSAPEKGRKRDAPRSPTRFYLRRGLIYRRSPAHAFALPGPLYFPCESHGSACREIYRPRSAAP